MDLKEFRKKSTNELEKELTEKTKALHDFRFGNSTNKSKNVKLGKNLKKEIAQIHTIVREMKTTQK